MGTSNVQVKADHHGRTGSDRLAIDQADRRSLLPVRGRYRRPTGNPLRRPQVGGGGRETGVSSEWGGHRHVSTASPRLEALTIKSRLAESNVNAVGRSGLLLFSPSARFVWVYHALRPGWQEARSRY